MVNNVYLILWNILKNQLYKKFILTSSDFLLIFFCIIKLANETQLLLLVEYFNFIFGSLQAEDCGVSMELDILENY